MTADPTPVDPQSLWKNQPMAPRSMTAADIRERARRYGERKRTETIVGVTLGVIAMAVGLAVELFVLDSTLPRVILAAAIVLLGVAIRREALQLNRRATPMACLEFYRKGLDVRRRQLSLSFDLWFGIAAFIALLVRRLPGLPWYFYVLLGTALGGLFAVRYRESRKASREIVALDKLLATE